MQFFSDPVVVAVILLAAVVGAVVSRYVLRPSLLPLGPPNGDDSTFKGHLFVYYKGTPDDPPKKSDYKKRPKNKLKVLFREVGGVQWGSVTFDNRTNEQVIVKFSPRSPFQSSGAQDIAVGANSFEEKTLTNDPGSDTGVDDYPFTVKIKKKGVDGYYDFDPGVRVRRG